MMFWDHRHQEGLEKIVNYTSFKVGGGKGVRATAVASQSVFPLPIALALAGNLLEMQISGSRPRPTELDPLGEDPELGVL